MSEYYQMRNLISQLNEATKWYDEGNPVITDSQWDDMYFKLQELEAQTGIIYPDSPTSSISYKVVNSLKKVEHSHPMLSLAKTKNEDDIYNFFTAKHTNPIEIIAMLKMDGLTCSLTYEGGKLIQAETRGNGAVGEDVTHNARVVKNIPQTIQETNRVVVDGEIICTYADFSAFASQYKNPRNFAAGSIRLLDSAECSKRSLSFVAWDLIEGVKEDITMVERLVALLDWGFAPVPWKLVHENDSFNVAQVNTTLKREAEDFRYPIDGIVYKFNDVAYGETLGQTGHHKNNAIAFKFEDDIYETTMIDIEWGQGREGALCPVAVFAPVDDGESTISRASLHNISVMNKLYPTPWPVGLSVNVAKMNQIIPQIVSINEEDKQWEEFISIPTVCPVCGAPTEVRTSDSGVDELWCGNPECAGKTVNILEHFLCKKGLDAKGISKVTIQKLLDWGWVSKIEDLFNLSQYKDEWIKKVGFGPMSVDKALNSIESAKDTTLDKYICAIGIPLVGSTVAKEIAKRKPTWAEFRAAVNERYDFSTWPGFGPEMTAAILNYNYEMADRIAEIMRFKVPEANEQVGDSLKGQTVVITGKLKTFKNRQDFQAQIEARGGKVLSAVTKNAKYLVNNDKASKSAKNLKAQELGIPVLSEEEFISQFLT